ncbi:alpha/beta fold hydrolase [Pseudomonas syringae group genomosp. 3]|uniref:alpha/beta fold hydrolase n=1 Tax=Pseudomonas syringae group genomosp. 3 TaxID=251701 RepID=UPI000EFE296C|nr:alpha/beta hydrolase [Pseudomonas syringae group genomosp. 3]
MYDESNTSSLIQIDNLTIHYHDTKEDKPALILLHGGGPGASSWSNFRDNLPELSEKFRVLAIDMPHFGKSSKPVENFCNTGWYAQIVRKVLTALDVNSAHFIGNSLGGSVSLEIALEHPEMVKRLVLMGTAGSLAMFSPLPTEGAKHLIQYYQGEGPTREKLESFIRSMIFDQSRITPEFLESRYQASIAPELMVKRELNFDSLFTLWRRVDAVKHKTLLIYGRDDRVVPWDTSLLLMRLMPNADLHIFSSSGHWTQWERAPEFNSLVSHFLLDPSNLDN